MADQMVKINGRLGGSHFGPETRGWEPHLSRPVPLQGGSDGDGSVMGPGRHGGVGATLGAAAVALVVAILVGAMVSIGGGLNRPIVTNTHVAASAAAPSQG
jgi:hypothetical protein